jgi:RNA polymerase sigma factor (sigma-70 family)
MAVGPLNHVVRHLRRSVLSPDAAEATDGQLLESFIQRRDENAFARLMARHGPMVLGVCQRLLRHAQDAEDAVQVTFLVLARKAASLRSRELIGNWLYGVAYRAALEVRSARRRRRERQVRAMPEPQAQDHSDLWGELRSLLDRELERLSEKYRLAIVLCDLEGRTRRQVARQLNIPEGTLSGRLTTARRILARRLARHGLALSAGALAATLSHGAAPLAVPASLASSTLKAVTGPAAEAVSAQVAALLQGVLKTMLLTKLRGTLAWIGVLILAGAGVFPLVGTGPFSRPAAATAEEPVAQQGAPLSQRTGDADPGAKRPDKPAEHLQVAQELSELRGTWTRTISERPLDKGEAGPPRNAKTTFIIVDDLLVRLDEDGFSAWEWTLRLDPRARPKTIDLVSPRSGTQMGIYELTGDQLRIYLAAEPDQRPTHFQGPPTLLWDLRRVSRTAAPVRHRFPNAPNCYWIIEPTRPCDMLGQGDIALIYEKADDGSVVVFLAAARTRESAADYRPVLLDAAGKRCALALFPQRGSMTSSRGDGLGVALSRWRTDPKGVPASGVAWVGVEARTPEYHRSVAAAALQRARQEGVEVLPRPVVGQPFTFTATTVDGKNIRSQDLHGKVVLIDCWASWCSPCLQLQPEIKELYEKYHAKGLEVIGFSLDQDSSRLKKTSEKLGMGWPQVWVPADEKVRTLWQDASQIKSIPRLFLIDRKGVLRADTPALLEPEIVQLLGGR